MAQFDVFRSPRGARFPLVVDVQSDLHAKLNSRLVAPLQRRNAEIATRLTPIVSFQGSDYLLLPTLAAAIAKIELGPRMGSLAAERSLLIAAFDLLLTGA